MDELEDARKLKIFFDVVFSMTVIPGVEKRNWDDDYFDDLSFWDDAKKNITPEKFAESKAQFDMDLTFDEFCKKVEEYNDSLAYFYSLHIKNF